MTYRPTDRFENWFITSLQTDVNDTTTSFRLNKALNVHQARLVIDPYDETKREIVKVTSVDGNLVYVERGDDNTAPEYHNEGTIVALHVFAADMNDIYADWAEVESDMQQALLDAADATGDANSAASSANIATGLANTATGNANDAAGDANLAAGSATSAASSANTAAGLANSATSAANTAAGNAQDAADAANEVVDDITAAAFLAAHPVGSTYWNKTVSTNPSVTYGGTWVRLEGVVLGGRSETGGSPFNVAAGTVIGSDTHTLTVAQMPAHNHSKSGVNGYFSGTGVSSTTGWLSAPAPNNIAFTAIGNTIQETGGGGSHPNIQRTLVGYLWERTA